MTQARIIRGRATLVYADNFAMLRRLLLRFYISLFLLCLVVYCALWFLTATRDQGNDFANNPSKSLLAMASDVALPIGAILLILPPLLIGVSALRFARAPAVHKRLAYEVDATRLVVGDEANFRHEMPWTAVKEVRRSRRILLFRYGRRLYRFALVRAFTEEENEQIVAWARGGG